MGKTKEPQYEGEGPWPATADDVARLTRPQREARVAHLVEWSRRVVGAAIIAQVVGDRRSLAAVAILFSGGNDSTVMAHIFHRGATHAVMANTGIGVEETRQYVRDCCTLWGLPLLEEHPPASYRDIVLGRVKGIRGGFPGPGGHGYMYQRLKERCFESARTKLVRAPHRERMIYLAGRRRDESERRSTLGWVDRKKSMVFVSPMLLWTKLDLNTYRLMVGDVPRNAVSDALHMSAECLCGAYAHEGELDEIGDHYPGTRGDIEEIETALRDAKMCACGHALDRHEGGLCSMCEASGPSWPRCAGWRPMSEWRLIWGFGASKRAIERMQKDGMTAEQIAAELRPAKTGIACSSCDGRAA